MGEYCSFFSSFKYGQQRYTLPAAFTQPGSCLIADSRLPPSRTIPTLKTRVMCHITYSLTSSAASRPPEGPASAGGHSPPGLQSASARAAAAPPAGHIQRLPLDLFVTVGGRRPRSQSSSSSTATVAAAPRSGAGAGLRGSGQLGKYLRDRLFKEGMDLYGLFRFPDTLVMYSKYIK